LTSFFKTNKCEDADLLKLANTKSGFSSYHLTEMYRMAKLAAYLKDWWLKIFEPFETIENFNCL